MMQDYLLCSNCFFDQGLKLEAQNMGILNEDALCKSCKNTIGYKLNKDSVERLVHRFFVRGSLHKNEYGAAPILQANYAIENEIKVSAALLNDITLINKCTGIGIFYYGPREWMVGEVEPLKMLVDKTQREEIISRILKEYPIRILTPKDNFYRLRKFPSDPNDPNEYDSPPFPSGGRLDSDLLSIMYCSQDLEVCVHECRATVEDDLFIATLSPTKNLKFLDLSQVLDEDILLTEFESLDMAVHMLFFASVHSYDACRSIAIYAEKAGFDGIIYPSYFSNIRTGAMPFDTYTGISIRKFSAFKDQNFVIPNLALFGKPVSEKKVLVTCINKLILNQVKYDLLFGPVLT